MVAGKNGRSEMIFYSKPVSETSKHCDDRSMEEMVNEGDEDGLRFAAYALSENVELVPFMNHQLRYRSK